MMLLLLPIFRLYVYMSNIYVYWLATETYAAQHSYMTRSELDLVYAWYISELLFLKSTSNMIDLF